MTVLHRQQQRLAPWGHALFLVAILWCLGVPLWVPDEGPVRIVSWTTAALVFLAFLHFERVTVVVTPHTLLVGFPLLKSRIPLQAIEGIEMLDRIPLWGWGGIGLRWRPGRSGGIGYLAGSGPGARIRRRPGRDVVFSCPDPKALARAVEDTRRAPEDGE
jgi:hypothetical protein